MNEPLIQLEGVAFAYGSSEPVLDGIDLSLGRGERVGLVGPIGCGKTTLLHLIVGLLRPTAGTIRAFGKRRADERDFHEVRRRAGLVFQYADDQLFCPTVLEDVAFGPLNLGQTAAEATAVAAETLDLLGLKGFGGRITYKLSGGEKRLVALATVLAMAPDVLLLDEPTSGLDDTAVDRLTEILAGLPQAMVIASHDREFVKRTTNKTVELPGRSSLTEGP